MLFIVSHENSSRQLPLAHIQ